MAFNQGNEDRKAQEEAKSADREEWEEKRGMI